MINIHPIHHNPLCRIFVPETENDRLEQLVKKMHGPDVRCELPIRHKTTLIPPSILKENNIKFARVSKYKFWNIKCHQMCTNVHDTRPNTTTMLQLQKRAAISHICFFCRIYKCLTF